MDSVDPAFARPAVQAAYDTVAEDYAATFGDDLAALPLDRQMLEMLAARCLSGLVADLGCGPGFVAAHLAASGAATVGVDLSAGMLATAARRVPGLALVQADLRALPLRDGVLSGAASYYVIQHLPRVDLPLVLAEIHRVLAAGGVMVLSAHLGQGELFSEVFLGHPVGRFGGCLYGRDELASVVESSGLVIEVAHERGPLPHEVATPRLYILAVKP